MYHVSVFLQREYQREVMVDSNSFNFGDWTEIGYWLDKNGYGGSEYKVEIRFSE